MKKVYPPLSLGFSLKQRADIKKPSLLKAILAFLLTAYFMITCAQAPTTPEVMRNNIKKTDPEKQEEKCQVGQDPLCSKDKKCKKVCQELFSKNSHEKACLKLPEKTVLDFEELFKTLEKGEVDDLNLDTLECLLDIDDTEFARAVKKLSSGEAKDFLIAVADDDKLARVLEEEDDEFNILKQAFSKAGLGYKLRDILTDELEDDKSFFHIVAEEENEPAYKWVDEYVEEICEKRKDTLQCPGEKREKLGAYCKAFIQHYLSELSGFLSSADLFEDDYRKKIESAGKQWTVSGFQDFCQDEYSVSPSSDSSSSTGSPTSSSSTTGVSSSSSSSSSTGSPTSSSSTTGVSSSSSSSSSTGSPTSSSSTGSTPPPSPPPNRNARIQAITSPCPNMHSAVSSIPNNRRFARIDYYDPSGSQADADNLYYHKTGFIDRTGGTAKTQDRGSSTPAQDIIRAIHFANTISIWLDKDLISGFSTANTWFFYNHDSAQTALTLSHASSYTEGGISYEKFTVSGSIADPSQISIAYQDSSNHCNYILPPAS